MILCVDIGNSLIKCAVVGAGRVLGREEIETARCGDTTTLKDLIRRVSSAVLSIEYAAISSVVPRVTPSAKRIVEEQLGVSPQLISYAMRLPFKLDVPDPSQVGTDRICSAAGALGEKGRNGIIIDAGSAITVDLVRRGSFLGGIILAGPSMILNSLHQFAGQLPKIDYRRIKKPFPSTCGLTKDAMVLGAGLGSIGGINESVKFLEKAVGARPQKFLTGGQAARLASRLPRSWKLKPNITLKGIYNIFTLNQQHIISD